jgi:hypothetical protein
LVMPSRLQDPSIIPVNQGYFRVEAMAQLA